MTSTQSWLLISGIFMMINVNQEGLLSVIAGVMSGMCMVNFILGIIP